MKKIGLFQKIDILYTKATKAIIGDTPMNDDNAETISSSNTKTSLFQTKLQTFKDFTKTHIDKVKKVGLKESILTMGEPDKKDVLYQEIVKKEKQEAKKLLEEEKMALKAATILEKEKKVATKKALAKKKTASTKKTIPKKEISEPSTKKKTKKPISKKIANEKTSSKTKKVSVKKPLSKKVIEKKESTTKTELKNTATKPSTKISTIKKSVGKRDAKIALYCKDIEHHYGEVDKEFLTLIVKNLGPSIYKKNAELVSCSNPKELDTVRKNFLMKKLGINASQDVLNAAIADVCIELKETKKKYRATFYYSLAKKFKKESVLS